MPKDIESASQMMKQGKRKMRVESVRIEPAANGGFIVNVNRVSVAGSTGNVGSGPWEPSQPYTFTKRRDLHKFLGEIFPEDS